LPALACPGLRPALAGHTATPSSSNNPDWEKATAAELSEIECFEVLPEIALIQDPKVKQGVIAVWQQTGREMAWDTLTEVPENFVNEADRSLISHVRSVTNLALAIADSVKASQRKDYDRDLLLAACLLHDVSKTRECESAENSKLNQDGVRPGVKSRVGRNMPLSRAGTRCTPSVH
jgi:hypothetical protein